MDKVNIETEGCTWEAIFFYKFILSEAPLFFLFKINLCELRMYHYFTGFTNFANNILWWSLPRAGNDRKNLEGCWKGLVYKRWLRYTQQMRMLSFYTWKPYTVYTIRSKKHNMVKNAQQRPLGTYIQLQKLAHSCWQNSISFELREIQQWGEGLKK